MLALVVADMPVVAFVCLYATCNVYIVALLLGLVLGFRVKA